MAQPDAELARVLHDHETRLGSMERAGQLRRSTVPGPDGSEVGLVPAVQSGLAAGAAIPGLREDLTAAEQQVADAMEEVEQSREDIGTALSQAGEAILAADQLATRIEDEVLPAISDAAASPVTDERLASGSLTVWPFADSTIPLGALKPGAVGSTELADFSVAVTKLRDRRHHLY